MKKQNAHIIPARKIVIAPDGVWIDNREFVNCFIPEELVVEIDGYEYTFTDILEALTDR